MLGLMRLVDGARVRFSESNVATLEQVALANGEASGEVEREEATLLRSTMNAPTEPLPVVSSNRVLTALAPSSQQPATTTGAIATNEVRTIIYPAWSPPSVLKTPSSAVQPSYSSLAVAKTSKAPTQRKGASLTTPALRALSSVLFESHLVSQNRLEVALSIQCMLRSVDLNYQLGEVLIMFKFLTPDQWLAANLVSCGLLSMTQINALERARQELYAVGLEYDLEGLLVLLRVVSPEQLREMRANW